jgi:hypothetical protein
VVEEEEVVAVVLDDLGALSQAGAVRDTGIEEHLHDGASFRQSHQAGSKWDPVVDWPT